MRTFLRGKVTLLFMMLGLLLAIPAIALADTLLIQNDLNVNANATHAPGDTGTANVVLNVTNGTPAGDTNGCNANGSNPLTATLSSNNADVTFPSGNTASITGCGVAVPVSYAVAANSNGGTAVISATVSGGRPSTTTEPRTYNTSDTLSVTITPPPNTAPSKPGKPALASGFNTPNQGIFDLTWTASTDDGKPNPPAAVTYRLEHQDANDAAYSLVSGAGTLSTNSFSFPATPATSNEAEGTWTYQVKASDSLLSSAFSDASSAIKVDKSAPSAPVATTTPGSPVFDGWFKDTVTVSYNGSTDPALLDTSAGSGVASYTANQPFSTSGTHNFSGKATDGAGNQSDPVTGSVKVDATNPTFDACTGGPFTQGSGTGSQQSVAIDATDAHSGMNNAGSTLSGMVNTSTIGDKTVTFTAKDNVGHEITKQCTYKVIYNFSGFFRPVDNDGVINTVKAGQSIPVKFSLSSDQVLSIFAASSPASQKVACDAGAALDALEETATAGSSGLSYDASIDQYNYVWKSDKAWAGSCRKLSVTLIDGTVHTANFKFLK
jgi:hypothetical protein